MRARKTRWSGLLVATVAVLGVTCGRGERGVRLVLVTLDTLRYDAFAPKGEEQSAMPHLRRRAEAGASFTRFYTASPLTQPSHASMFTGRHPWQHGVTSNGHVLDDDELTVAEVLKGAGFETHAVVASFPVAARFGFAQGFDTYREEFAQGFLAMQEWEGHSVPGGEFFSAAPEVTRSALDAVDGAPSDNQFFWFHYFDPHAPYGSSKGGSLSGPEVLQRVRAGADAEPLLQEIRELYRTDVAFLDAHLEELLTHLFADDDYETHVLLVADHGESLGERGSIGHGYRLNRFELHVPAVLLSGRVTPGERGGVAGSIDVAATLLALAGVDAPAAWGGQELVESDGPGAAYGMRRTFRTPAPMEVRLGGQVGPLPELFFYGLEGEGPLRRGNARGEGVGVGVELDAVWVERFAGFERELGLRAGEGELEPGVSEVLRSLGYAE